MPVKKKIFSKKIFFILFLFALFGSYKIYEYSKFEKTDNAYIEANISVVSSEYNGVIREVLVEENQKVEKDQAIAKIDNNIVISPIAGTIAMHNIRIGNYVQPGMPLVAVVPDQLYLKANFKETQIDNFEIGSEVFFTVDAVPGKKFNGRVKSIYPATGAKFALIPTDNATGNFTKIIQRIPVIIAFDNNQEGAQKLKPGMSSTVIIYK